jgi:hypothetical protein
MGLSPILVAMRDPTIRPLEGAEVLDERQRPRRGISRWLGRFASQNALEPEQSDRRDADSPSPPQSLLDSVPDQYEIVQTRNDNRTDAFAGRDVSAFIERRDNGFHSHEVKDAVGERTYLRDKWGKVQVGTDLQMKEQERRRQVGRTAVEGAARTRERDRTREQ